MSRIIVWYSDGAASAVAAKIALESGEENVEIVKCDTTDDEHPDNYRFRSEVESWLNVRVKLIRSQKYKSVDDVFRRTRFMSGPAGARCTTELKKLVRKAYERDDDVHVFGYTADERKRAERFEELNPELRCWWPLIEQQITKTDCYHILDAAGIRLPAMYALGYEHNNCLGCVKASSPFYWARIRRDFPEAFNARAVRSRELGARLVRLNGERIFLDELPDQTETEGSDGAIECGPFCEMDGPSLFAQTQMPETP